MATIACFKCGHTWQFELPLGRKDDCPSCRWDAHVCLNCVYYDKNAHHECREPQAEFVQDKERSNFCDYFSSKATQSQIGESMAAHKSKLENLFSNQGQKIDDDDDTQPLSLADELDNFLKNR